MTDNTYLGWLEKYQVRLESYLDKEPTYFMTPEQRDKANNRNK